METRESHWDDQDPKADPSGIVETISTSTATCSVVSVELGLTSTTSVVECDEPLEGLSGTWGSDSRGLFRLPAPPTPGTPTLVTTDMFVLAALPIPFREEKPGVEPGFGEVLSVTEEEGVWCATREWWGGDDGHTTLCFADGAVVRGASGWSGGSTRQTTFTRLTPEELAEFEPSQPPHEPEPVAGEVAPGGSTETGEEAEVPVGASAKPAEPSAQPAPPGSAPQLRAIE